MKGVVALAVAAFVTGCGGGATNGQLGVTHANLTPGRIVLVLANHSEDDARVEQVIVNDAFVDFRISRNDVPPGDIEAVVVFYPWIEGESYEVRLMTSTGATIDYELEDAETGNRAAAA